MFKFDFDVEAENDEEDASLVHKEPKPELEQKRSTCKEHTCDELASKLPPAISYSLLEIPSLRGEKERSMTSGSSIIIPRRDLYDARFQILAEMSDGQADKPSDEASGGSASLIDAQDQQNTSLPDKPATLGFVDAPSDLIPNVYEGGLKTWECSLDLAGWLDAHYTAKAITWAAGRRILELGCGSAVPTLYILQQLFQVPPSEQEETLLELQDYNDSVLELITFPNLLLTWYLSPAAETYRSSEANACDITLPAGEISITSEILLAFKSSLSERQISLRLWSGSWEGFIDSNSNQPYDLVLSSETIYRVESVPALISVLRRATKADLSQGAKDDLPELGNLTISRQPRCLIAAKIIYFGVGGSISDFVKQVGESEGAVNTIWEKKDGVRRAILDVSWLPT